MTRELPGPSAKPEAPAMAAALLALDARKGPPTEADAPPIHESLKGLPWSPGQRAAMRLKRQKETRW